MAAQSQQGQPQDQRPSGVNVPRVIPPTTESRAKFFPEVEADDFKKIAQDTAGVSFDASANERAVFDNQYNSVARQYFSEAVPNTSLDGQVLLRLFEKWREVVAQFALAAMRGDKVADNLGATLSVDPQGSPQAMLRRLRQDSLATTTNVAPDGQTPTASGQFNIFPDDEVGDDTLETPEANEKAWVVLGYIEYASGAVPYSTVQMRINDTRGVYREQYIRDQMTSAGPLKVVEARTPGFVLPGTGLDIDVDVVRTNIQTQLWPIAFEVIGGGSGEIGGVQG